ncbi:MAG: DNA repair protein RadC [Pseudomonadota bacterium]
MIQNLPADSRPSEKLINIGPHSLSDAELLSVILRTGSQNQDVINLAQVLIERCGGLSGLLNCNYSDVSDIRGLGTAKYSQIAAIKEISYRSLKAELKSVTLLNNPKVVSEFLMTLMKNYQKEVFACLLLNSQNQLISYEELFKGSISGASVYPREVIKTVLNANASAVIFAHNHPSGCTYPSEADKSITKQLKHALNLIDVRVLDHIIVGNDTFSMAEQGMI